MPPHALDSGPQGVAGMQGGSQRQYLRVPSLQPAVPPLRRAIPHSLMPTAMERLAPSKTGPQRHTMGMTATDNPKPQC